MADVNQHPDEATWEKLATGELDDAARDAAFDHITSCRRCSRIWRGVLTLGTDAQAQGLISAATPSRRSWRQSPVVALAIAATLIIAIGGIVIERRLNDQAKSRGNAQALVEEPTTTIGADGVPTLTWKLMSGASQYRVEMFSEDGDPVWSLEVDAPPVRWPADVLRKVGTYRWRVEALKDGAVLARSRIVVMKVER